MDTDTAGVITYIAMQGSSPSALCFKRMPLTGRLRAWLVGRLGDETLEENIKRLYKDWEYLGKHLEIYRGLKYSGEF